MVSARVLTGHLWLFVSGHLWLSVAAATTLRRFQLFTDGNSATSKAPAFLRALKKHSTGLVAATGPSVGLLNGSQSRLSSSCGKQQAFLDQHRPTHASHPISTASASATLEAADGTRKKGGQHSVPFSHTMRRTLKNVGLELSERLIVSQISGSAIAPTFMVVVAGLARGCHDRSYMAEFIAPCGRGEAAFTLSLQFSHGTVKSNSDRFDPKACEMSIRHAASLGETRCSLAFVSQAFVVTRKPCGDGPLIPDRVAMQTLAVGRAYQWAKLHFPWEASFYVRVRLDDVGWCLPVGLPSASNWLLLNNVHMFHNMSTQQRSLLWVSDRFGVAPARAAPIYFGAWQIWRPGVHTLQSRCSCLF